MSIKFFFYYPYVYIGIPIYISIFHVTLYNNIDIKDIIPNKPLYLAVLDDVLIHVYGLFLWTS